MIKIGIDKGHPVGQGASGVKSETDMNRPVGNLLIQKINSNPQLKAIDCTVENGKESLQKRCDIANNNGVDLFISLHLNAGVSSAKGIETLVSRYNKNKNFANLLQKNLANTSVCSYNRGVRVDYDYLKYDLYVLKNTKMDACLIEMGFCTNQNDMNIFNVEVYADTIYKSILQHYGIQEVSKPTQPQPNTGIKVGDKVKPTGTYYFNSTKTIPQWVKDSVYTVGDITSNNVLLQEITSRVNIGEVQLVGSTPTQRVPKVGDSIKIIGSKYSTGQSIPQWVKNNTYTIQQIGDGKVLVSSIVSWVNNGDYTLL